MFERRSAAVAGRGDSPLDAELRRVLDSIVVEWVGEPHGRRREAAVAGARTEVAAEVEAEVAAGAEAVARFDARLAAGAERLDRLATQGGEHLARAREAQLALARAAAAQARALAGFARCRPSSFDRPESEVGAAAARTRAARPAALAEVSEWAVDEVMTGLGLTGHAAQALLVDSLLLVDRLPLTLGALEEGRISWAHAQVMTELVAPLGDDLRAEAEQRLLSRAEGRTRAQLRAAARRLVQKLDAAAVARRVTEAIRQRRVAVHAGDDGMATLSAVLPAPVARAVQDALRRYADAAAVEGDERTREQRMVDCLVDLVLRPGEHGLAPVQAQLTLVAAVETLLGGDEPGEVDGDLVPAQMVRELAEALGLMPRTGPPAPATSEPGAAGETSAGPGSGTEAESALTELLSTRRLRGTALAHRPHLALVDELSGQLVALTDTFELRAAVRAGRALGPPPETPAYAPAEALDRFVRLRDRRCRFPGCRARPIRCDLDHTVPHPFGPTAHGNLCCLCRHHHRLSHQAPGWTLRGVPDGGLEWTTPTGQVLVTRPPRFGADDDVTPVPGRAGPPPPAPPTPPPVDADVPPF